MQHNHNVTSATKHKVEILIRTEGNVTRRRIKDGAVEFTPIHARTSLLSNSSKNEKHFAHVGVSCAEGHSNAAQNKNETEY